jgi:transposase-like protein
MRTREPCLSVPWLSIPEFLRSLNPRSQEIFTFYRLPKEHHKHLKSTDMLERLNQELKQRIHVIVIRIFSNPES